MIKEKFDELIGRLKEEAISFYGEQLVTLAIFGSVASETMLPDSDLDLFICARDLPRGRRSRIKEFQTLEDRLETVLSKMRKAGVHTVLSPVIKTPEETELGSLLFIDMTEDVKILYDKEGFFRNYLDNLKKKLLKLGSKKIKIGSAWFWDLVPNYKLIGEVSL